MNKNTIVILSCLLSFIEGGLIFNVIREFAAGRAIHISLLLLTFGIAAIVTAGIITIVNPATERGKTFIDTAWGDKCVRGIKVKWKATH